MPAISTEEPPDGFTIEGSGLTSGELAYWTYSALLNRKLLNVMRAQRKLNGPFGDVLQFIRNKAVRLELDVQRFLHWSGPASGL
jgi:hypothetical protein